MIQFDKLYDISILFVMVLMFLRNTHMWFVLCWKTYISLEFLLAYITSQLRLKFALVRYQNRLKNELLCSYIQQK